MSGRGYNLALQLGNVVNPPEQRTTAKGSPVTSFRLAVTQQFTATNGSRQEETTFFRVVLWGKLADEAGTYLHKGDRVFVEGRLGLNVWTDPSGHTQRTPELTARRLIFLGDAHPPAVGEPGSRLTVAAEDLSDLDSIPDLVLTELS